MPELPLDAAVAGLRKWTARHDPHVRAAVELLIEHRYWIDDDEFTGDCVKTDAGGSWIDWQAAAEYAAPSAAPQRAVLRFAVALADDRFRLSRMDDDEAGMILRAVMRALAIPVTEASGAS